MKVQEARHDARHDASHGVLLLIVHRFMFESRMDSVVCALVVSIIPKTEDVKLERVQAGRGHSLSSVPL